MYRFLGKTFSLDWWGAAISGKMLGLDGWLARAFLEKKLGKYGYGAYFSREGLVCMAGARISR